MFITTEFRVYSPHVQSVQGLLAARRPDYMLRIMRDSKVDDPRPDEMAKAVAPYVHPRLAIVPHTAREREADPGGRACRIVRAGCRWQIRAE
jgi:hypothetical protein